MTELTLRPIEEHELPIMERLTQDPESAGEFAFFGWNDPLRYRREWAETRMLSADRGNLMVVRGAEPIGFVVWAKRVVTTTYCFVMGIAILPEARGQGNGTEAHRLLCRYLFAHTPVHRIEADTEVDNIAEQKALEKAGFTREGVMRGVGWRDGAWRDGVRYARLRTDPPA